MARTKKASSPSKKDEKNDDGLISAEDVWDVLKFASNLYGGVIPQYGISGVYNPMLTNDIMKNMTLHPQAVTSDQVDKALADPKNNEQNLIGYSEFFELSNMLYKRILYYLSGMLSFDLTYVCINAEPDDYKTTRYKGDLQIVQDFLDKFDVKKEFKTILRQMLRQEAYFGILRDDGEKYVMQEIDESYCLITGRFDYGLLFDYNAIQMLNPGFDIDFYPEIFKTFYDKIFRDGNSANLYNPAASVMNRDKNWVYWIQTSPEQGFACFKFNEEIGTRVPFFAPLFPDVVNGNLIRKLQTNSYISEASKILVGKIPMINNPKGAGVRDSLAISPELLGKFLALLKAGLAETVRVAGSPLENMQGVEFTSRDYYQQYLKTTGSASGIDSRLIFTIDKPTQMESQLSTNVDEYLIGHVYNYFNDFLNYHINKRTKKYKFRFFFEGTNLFTNRAERLDTQLKLMPFGIVNYQKIASAIGQLPHHFLKQLQETKAIGFVDMLTPIRTSATLSSNYGGAPKKSAGDLSDSGAQARDDSGNY
jgi:hypothetical protein